MKGKGKRRNIICLSRTKHTKDNAKENLEEQSNYSEESETERRNETLNNAKLYTGIKRKNPSSERCTFSQEENHFSGGSDLPASMRNQSRLDEFKFDNDGDDIGVSQAKDGRQSSSAHANTNVKFRRIHQAVDAQGVRSTHISHNTNTLNEVEDQQCPMCSTTFTPSKNIEFINKHVEHCLNNEAQELTGNRVKREEIVYEAEAEEQIYDSQGSELNNKIVICQICQKDLSQMNSQRRLQHMNRCCDKVEQKQKSTRNMAHPQTSQLSCVICGKPFKSAQAQQRHLKKCAQQHGVSTSQVLQLVHNQEQQQQLPALVASRTATVQPSDSRGASKRKTRGVTNIRNIDEETQLAMAFSASIAPVKRKGHGQRKKDQGNELPALLLRSREETRQVVAVRAAQVICPQEDEDDNGDDLISSTPALAPSKLAQNNQMENKTSSSERIDAVVKNQDEGSEVINVTASADVAISSTAEHLNQTDVLQSICCSENEQSRIAVCAALSQSFVNFIQEDEAARATSKPLEPKATFCPLWSLATLDVNNSNPQDFYVPWLLPEKSAENVSKDSARESSKTSKSPVSESHANQTTTWQQNDAMISDSTLVSRTPHEPNAAGGCASDEITPTQEADALILADLADSIDVRDISLATQKVGSCAVGKFPASGFCLPVEGAVKDMAGCSSQEQYKPSEGVQHLLQELTAMIGNSNLSDVVLVTKGNYQIPAHSFMLSLRSKTLAEMLRSQTMTGLHQNHSDENGGTRRCSLSFEETEPVVMETALNFIYTGVVQVPVSWIDDVEKLSQRLQLSDLSKACEKLMEKLPCHETEEAAADEGCFLDGEDIRQVMLEEEEAGDGSDAEIKDSEYWEGFDDNDIEEIRLIQTQSIKERIGENAEDEVIYEEGSILSESGLLQFIGRDRNCVKSDMLPSQESDGNGANWEIHGPEELKDITEDVNKILDGSCPDLQREIRKVDGPPAERSAMPSPDKSIQPLDEEEKSDSGLAYEGFEMTSACDPPIDYWSDGDVGEQDQVSSEETGIQETAFMLAENDSNLELYLDCEANEDVDNRAGIVNSPVVYPAKEADESIELLSDDEYDAPVHAVVCSKAGKTTFVAETPHSPKKKSLSAWKRKDSTRPNQKKPRTDPIDSFDSSDSGDSASREDNSCSEVDHVPHDLNNEATKFLTNLRGRVAKASKKKRSNEKQAKRASTEVIKSPVAHVALASYRTQLSSPRPSDCQTAIKRPSSVVNSPVRSPKISRTSGLRVVDLTPSHLPLRGHVSSPSNTLRSTPSPSAQSPRTSETASTPSRSSRNSPQFSPTMFPSPRSSPTAVRSPVIQSKYREQGEHEKYFKKDILLDISCKDLGILDESVNLDLEERDEGVDFAVDGDEHGSPSSPVIMSPPAPSPRYSFLDPPSYSDPSPSRDIFVSCPYPPDELCCSPTEPVENQPQPPAIESPPEAKSVVSNESSVGLELSAESSIIRATTVEQKKLCARNLHYAEDLCVKKAGKTKHKKPTVDLNLGLLERLKAKQTGSSDNSCLQADEDCSSVEEENSHIYSRTESTPKTNTKASGSTRFQFHDDGGFNCDLGDTYAEVPAKDETITTTSREDTQSVQELQRLGENVANAEFGITVSGRKREQVADDVNAKTAQTDGTRKKPRSQQVSSDSDESSNKQSQKERRGTKSKLGKGCEKARKCGEKGAKKVMTPMPDYDDMVTPNLRKELQRFGVRALPKRKMITKLTEIYQYTHRPSSDQESNDNEVATAQLSCEGGTNQEVPRASNSQTVPATVRSESDTARTGESGEISDSDNSHSSDEEEFGDCTLEISSNEVTASQQVVSGNLNEILLRYIQDNKELYLKILQYKPIELLSFQGQIKSDGINCPLNKLVDFLDQQCITFTTANVRQRQRQRRKVGRKKKEKHVNKS